MLSSRDGSVATPITHVENPWKLGDLRGAFPYPISPELFESIGGAVGTMLSPRAKVLVMGDFRLSTLELKAALIQGLLNTGVSVVDAGQGPTPLAYFAARHIEADAVLMVTASHNPANENGLKLMIGAAPPSLEQLSMLRALSMSGDFREEVGDLACIDVLPAYERSLLDRWRHLQPLPHLVLDAGNGAWSEIAPRLLQALGFSVTCISCRVDGRFPDRPSDCSRTVNLSAVRAEVKRQTHSIGIAWDGDGDRVAFVDEQGLHVSTDEISILLVRAALRSSTRKEKVVIDIKLSDAVSRGVIASGGTPLLERTGHTFMRRRMIAEDASIGLDACGHYFFRELSGGDDGLFSALFLLDFMQQEGLSLSALRSSLAPIFSTPELRIPVDLLNYSTAVQQLHTAFPSAATMSIDGIRLMLEDGTILLRESGTEPLLSLRIEGFDRDSLDRHVETCLRCFAFTEELLRAQLNEQTQH